MPELSRAEMVTHADGTIPVHSAAHRITEGQIDGIPRLPVQFSVRRAVGVIPEMYRISDSGSCRRQIYLLHVQDMGAENHLPALIYNTGE